MIEYVKDGQRLIAIIIPSEYSVTGVKFLTPEDYPKQLAYMQHPKGHRIQSHVHVQHPRIISDTQEVIIMRKGRLKVDFFNENKEFIQSKVLEKGDIIFLVAGGHGFEAIEDIEMVEVKQGPYIQDKDKIKFEGRE